VASSDGPVTPLRTPPDAPRAPESASQAEVDAEVQAASSGAQRGSPFAPGNAAAVRHGATSERQIRPAAKAQRRRFLRQNGLRAGDLDGIGRGLLDNWARAQAKVELLDAYFERHGFLDARGKPRGGVQVYFTALNSARLALARLDEHLGRRVEVSGPLALLEAEGRRLRLAAEGDREH
jgi:hypothetical protein